MTDDSLAIENGYAAYGDPGFSRYLRRAILASAGYDGDDLSRPLIGITDLTSDFNPCHARMPELIEAIKRGVLEAGGVPFVFPTMSLGESFLTPTSMLYRNLLAMETEELVRAQPMDGVVLLGGCDKTVPAQLMAAAVTNVPAILEVVGPTMTGSWRGNRLGACTDCRRFWSEYRGGTIDDGEIAEVESSLVNTAGTCTVMGTASSMAVLAETLGMMLPGGASAPSPTGARLRHATATGRRAVELARERVTPGQILTGAAFDNALRVLAAIGGSTNAVVHLLAIARRAGVDLRLDDFDTAARKIPLLVDVKPSGELYMEDFHHAGGVPALLAALASELDLDHLGVSGRTLGEQLAGTEPGTWQRTIRTLDDPVGPTGALAALYGSLAPDGAVIKASAASPELLRHEGPAVVFDSPEDAAARLDDPSLGLTRDHVLVLRNAGPVAAGMPEAGSLRIPRHLAEQGVRDMVRVSDARMSGTSYGTVVLHCAPESAAGGPLSLVRDGDIVRLDVPARRIDLLVDEAELDRRRAAAAPAPVRPPERGWRRLYAETVTSASDGADLAFLAAVPRTAAVADQGEGS
ncbi:dihydroxy-acid dehydratase [Actinomadura roseirufa]|uniref:dihydroxy-acid dehydratase n=1 Tax=Actinomadura roseirufa TaxID=2094049 RepID=UPI001041B25E|nr:dihydroxy-acid dehydratase [Actinomadura roseirufa]